MYNLLYKNAKNKFRIRFRYFRKIIEQRKKKYVMIEREKLYE